MSNNCPWRQQVHTKRSCLSRRSEKTWKSSPKWGRIQQVWHQQLKSENKLPENVFHTSPEAAARNEPKKETQRSESRHLTATLTSGISANDKCTLKLRLVPGFPHALQDVRSLDKLQQSRCRCHRRKEALKYGKCFYGSSVQLKVVAKNGPPLVLARDPGRAAEDRWGAMDWKHKGLNKK